MASPVLSQSGARTPLRCPRVACKLFVAVGFFLHILCCCWCIPAACDGVLTQESSALGRPPGDLFSMAERSDSGERTGPARASDETGGARAKGEYTTAGGRPHRTDAREFFAGGEQGRLRPVRYPAYCLKCGEEVVRHRSVPPLSDASKALPLLLLQVPFYAFHPGRFAHGSD